MVMQFTPGSNESSTCAGVEAYEAARPPKSQSLHSLNLTLFIVSLLRDLLALVILWKWREKSRFRKVRPFTLHVLLAVALNTQNVAAFLAYVTPIPCAVIVMCYTLALSSYGVICTERALCVLLEVTYSRLAKNEKAVIHDETASLPTSSASTKVSTAFIHVSGLIGQVRTLLKVLLGLLGVIEWSTLNISELAFSKNSYVMMFVIISVPSIATFIILLAMVPAYRTCSDCDVFLELPIAIYILMTLYVGGCTKAIWTAYKAIGWDDKGVLKELIIIPPLTGFLATATWVLMVLDPADLAYDRVFNWSALFFAPANVWVFLQYYYQIYMQWKQDHRTQTFKIVPREDYFSSCPGARMEFHEFAETHYVSESLNFLEDIKAYKSFYFEKAMTWRVIKFKSLVVTYILPGAKLEINISHGMKTKILKSYSALKGEETVIEELFEVFDEAVMEIDHMIHDGAWSEFLIRTVRPKSAVQMNASQRKVFHSESLAVTS
jgi:hypothetical protein